MLARHIVRQTLIALAIAAAIGGIVMVVAIALVKGSL